MLPTRKSAKALVFQWSGGPWGQCPCCPLQSTPATASEPAPGRTQHTLSRSQRFHLWMTPAICPLLPPSPHQALGIILLGTGQGLSCLKAPRTRISPLRTQFKRASFWGPFPRTGPNPLVVLFSHHPKPPSSRMQVPGGKKGGSPGALTASANST